ncbi:hypothetical protein BGX24_010585 [Mortierella sp. AD032]|nr:hypothetical protein BGX24_010585 [Mortierella sp. AD032]
MLPSKSKMSSLDSRPMTPNPAHARGTSTSLVEKARKEMLLIPITDLDYSVPNAEATIHLGSVGISTQNGHEGIVALAPTTAESSDKSALATMNQSCHIASRSSETEKKALTALTPSMQPPWLNIFSQNVALPALSTSLPPLGCGFEDTSQLAHCGNLLRKYFSSSSAAASIPSEPLDPTQRALIESYAQNENEMSRVRRLIQRVVEAFAADILNSSVDLSEVLLLVPCLNQEYYSKLLNCVIAEFETAKLLNIDLLQGLVQLVESASSDYLEPEDLIRILIVLRNRLQDNPQQSTKHPYHLTWAFSRLLDVMVEGKVKDLRRVVDQEPMFALFGHLKDNTDPYLQHQATYAFQGLMHVPSDEERRKLVLRHAGNITMGLLGVESVCKLDLNQFKGGADHLHKAAGESHEIGTKVADGGQPLLESSQGIRASIKGDFYSGGRQLWYSALREAQEHVRNGRLQDFNHLVFDAPCCTHIEFERGVIQLLGEIGMDFLWETATRHHAVDLLAELYRNKLTKDSSKDIDLWILNILNQIVALDDILISGHVQGLLYGLEKACDSGGGKSTFTLQLERTLWKNYSRDGPVPLHINLPSVDNPQQDLIAKQLRQLEFSEAHIMELKLHHQLILICDGYDESQQLVNLHFTNKLNQPRQWNTKMIISCRTQFLGPTYLDRFRPQSNDRYTSDQQDLFQEVIIAPFSREQIENYVEQYVLLEPRTWRTQDYMDRLTTIPDLLDLVRNPFLLTLALEALPGVTEGKKDLSKIKISRVQLYDTFVHHWFRVNQRRLDRNNALSRDDRDMLIQLMDAGFVSQGIEYSSKLAQAIFIKQNGNPVVQYVHLSEKNTWKAEFFGPQPEVRLLRESSPLTRTGNQFRFVHRSMLEYFLSRVIYNPTMMENQEFDSQTDTVSPAATLIEANGPLFRRNLVQEPSIIQFLCDRVKSTPNFEQELRRVVNQSKTDSSAATAATNAITILVKAGSPFNGADLRGVKIPGADLSDGQFDSVQLQGADLTGVILSRSWLRQADLNGAQLEGLRFGELPYLDTGEVIRACTYSPDGRMLAVGFKFSSSFSIYDTSTWIVIHRFTTTGEVLDIAFSPDSQQIVSAGMCGAVRTWDCTSGEEMLAMSAHTDYWQAYRVGEQ